MPLEELISQIEEDANQEIDEVIGEARAEVKRRLKEAEKKAKEEAETLKQRAERDLENKKKSEISKMRHEVKKTIMKKKEEVINRCFELAKERLKKLSGKDYITFVKPFVERGIKEIGTDCIIIPSREEDKAIAKELKLPIEKQMIKALGGVIVKSKDNRLSVDITFDSMLKRREHEIREKIGNLLFAES